MDEQWWEQQEDPLLGTTLNDRYRLDRRVGGGGMGRVYAGEHIRLGVPIAVKILHAELADDRLARERFIRESQLAASLRHPNVVRVYDADQADGLLFLVMDLIPGESLREMLGRQGQLAPGEALMLARQVASALDAAHASGLVHRDVKPANILVSGEHAYLSDFGLARIAGPGGGLTQTGRFLGTVDYAAPEQFTGDAVGPPADVYALACVIFEMLTGRRPFERPNEAGVMPRSLDDAVPSAAALRPALGPQIDRVFDGAFVRDPAARPTSASGLVDALRTALPRDPVAAHPPAEREPARPQATVFDQPQRQARPRPVPVASRWERNRRVIALAAACGLVAGAIGVGAGLATMHAGTRVTTRTGPTKTTTRAPRTTPVSFRPATLSVPETTRSGPAAGATTLGLGRGRTFVVAAGTRLVVADTRTADPTLLPARLRHHASGRAAVRIGGKTNGVQAYRYQLGRPVGEVYVVPTDKGVVTLVCLGTNDSGIARCRSIVATLAIRGAHVYGLGDPAFVSGLTRQIKLIGTRIASANAEAAQAQAPRDQAQIFAGLARNVLTTATRVSRLPSSPETRVSRDHMASALRQMHRALMALSVAATRQDAHAFVVASGRLESSQRLLSQLADRFGVSGN